MCHEMNQNIYLINTDCRSVTGSLYNGGQLSAVRCSGSGSVSITSTNIEVNSSDIVYKNLPLYQTRTLCSYVTG